ncbi:hypothetical protein DL98DRAFT_72480 [Cadophora sp. DSE1049]|nr:hypothetical protein DL98DRAFT_72480 [Cadophora sp. DSE1049]
MFILGSILSIFFRSSVFVRSDSRSVKRAWVGLVECAVKCVLKWKIGRFARIAAQKEGKDGQHFEKLAKLRELFLGLGKPVLVCALQTSLYCCHLQTAEMLMMWLWLEMCQVE